MGITKRFLFSSAAPFTIMAVPFVNFIVSRGYGLFHLEVGIVFLWISAAALALGAITAIGSSALRPVYVSVLIFLFLHIEIAKHDPPFLGYLYNLAGSELAVILVGVFAFTLLVMSAYWKLKDEFFVLVTGAFGAILLAVLVTSGAPDPRWEVRQAEAMARDPTLPPVVHVLLDGQIGIDGLPTEMREGRRLREDLIEFYTSRGFAVFSRAYTHFPLTLESVTNLFNNKVRPLAHRSLEVSATSAAIRRNRWFERLARRGYKIEVYQSRYLDFCSSSEPASSPVHKCTTYDHADLRYFRRLDTSSRQKARLLLKHFLDVDVLPPLMPALLFYQWLKFAGWPLPDLGAYRRVSASSLAGFEAMSRLSRRMETLKRGEAVFAHILLPHAPFVFDKNCIARKRADRWRGRSNKLWSYGIRNTPDVRTLRYRSYLAQSRCTHGKLDEILDKIAARPDLSDAMIIVHGDHGSKIVLQEPYSLLKDEITDRDIVDSYSTLFAIRKPGIAAGQVLEQRSIQGLFADLVTGDGDMEDHDDIFLQPDRGVVGPNQVRLPMVPIRP